VGNINVDIYVRVGKIPDPDDSVEAQEAYMGGGGSAANIALALARLGEKVRLIGCVGRDPLADIALTELAREGVDVSGVCRADAPTGTVVVIVEGGEKRMISHPGANTALNREIVVTGCAGSSHIHVSSNRVEVAEWGAEAAAEHGATYSLTIRHGIARLGLRRITRILSLAEMVFANAVEARELTGLGPAEAAETLSTEFGLEAVVTAGPNGAYIGRRGLVAWVPAMRAPAIVDATGAGDVYAAAYIYAARRGMSMVERARLAAAAAALKVARRGARSAPTLSEVLNYILTQGN